MTELVGHCLLCRRLAARTYHPTAVPLVVSYCDRAICQTAAILAAERWQEVARALAAMFYVPRYEPLRGEHKPGDRGKPATRRTDSRRRTASPRLTGSSRLKREGAIA